MLKPLKDGQRVHYPKCPGDLGTVQVVDECVGWISWDTGEDDPVDLKTRQIVEHHLEKRGRATRWGRTTARKFPLRAVNVSRKRRFLADNKPSRGKF